MKLIHSTKILPIALMNILGIGPVLHIIILPTSTVLLKTQLNQYQQISTSTVIYAVF